EIQRIKDFEYDNLQALDGHTYKGFEFKAVNGRKTFDFKGIDEWVDAKKGVEKIEKKAKVAFEMYQTTGQKPLTEDGELLPLPEINYGKSYLKISKTKK